MYNATKKSYFIHKIYISKQYLDVGRVKTWASCGIVDLSHKSRHDSHRLHHLAEIVFKTRHYRRKDPNQRQQTMLEQKAYLCRPAMEELGEELVLSWLSIKTNHPPIPHGFPASKRRRPIAKVQLKFKPLATYSTEILIRHIRNLLVPIQAKGIW